MTRAPLRRLRDWWHRRRGKRSRILDFLAGPDDDAGAGVREPRRPRHAEPLRCGASKSRAILR